MNFLLIVFLIFGFLGCGDSHTSSLLNMPDGATVPATSTSTTSGISTDSNGDGSSGDSGTTNPCRPNGSCSTPVTDTPTQFTTTSGGYYTINTAQTWTVTIPQDHLLRGLTVDADGIYMYHAVCISTSIERWYIYSKANSQNSWTQNCDLLSSTTFSSDNYGGLAVDNTYFYFGVAPNGTSFNKYTRSNCTSSGTFAISGGTVYNSGAASDGLFNVGWDQGTFFFLNNNSASDYKALKRYNSNSGSTSNMLNNGTLGAQTYSPDSSYPYQPIPFTVSQGTIWSIDVSDKKIWKWTSNGYPYAWADFPTSYYADLSNALGIYSQDGSSLIVATCANCNDSTQARTLKFYYFDISHF